jgi:hypothetical protein
MHQLPADPESFNASSLDGNAVSKGVDLREILENQCPRIVSNLKSLAS